MSRIVSSAAGLLSAQRYGLARVVGGGRRLEPVEPLEPTVSVELGERAEADV